MILGRFGVGFEVDEGGGLKWGGRGWFLAKGLNLTPNLTPNLTLGMVGMCGGCGRDLGWIEP